MMSTDEARIHAIDDTKRQSTNGINTMLLHDIHAGFKLRDQGPNP